MIPYWVTPDLSDSLVFFGVGFFGFIAQIYMTKAFQEKDEKLFYVFFLIVYGDDNRYFHGEYYIPFSPITLEKRLRLAKDKMSVGEEVEKRK